MEEKISKISVSIYSVGMVGLEDIFSQAREKQVRSEVELEKYLLEEAKKKNYIPANAEGKYAKALLREFKRFLGEKVEDDISSLQVRILGPGCINCQRLEQETLAALAELNLAADFDHVQDYREIAKYGVRGTPALAINGEVKCVGRIAPRDQIKKWLLEERRGK